MIARYLDAEEEQYFVHLFIYLFNHFHHNRETGRGGGRTTERGPNYSAAFYPPNHDIAQMTDHNTGNYMPYPLRQVCGFFYARGGGGGDSHMKQTGMLVVSLRVFRVKRQYFMPPRSRLGFREVTQNYAKRNRSQISF